MTRLLDAVRQALALKQQQQRPTKDQDRSQVTTPEPRGPRTTRSQVRRGAARGG